MAVEVASLAGLGFSRRSRRSAKPVAKRGLEFGVWSNIASKTGRLASVLPPHPQRHSSSAVWPRALGAPSAATWAAFSQSL